MQPGAGGGDGEGTKAGEIDLAELKKGGGIHVSYCKFGMVHEYYCRE